MAFSKSPASSSETKTAKVGAAERGPAAGAVTVSDTPKRTYLICVDTLHIGFGHFAQVPQGLAAFFRSDAGKADAGGA